MALKFAIQTALEFVAVILIIYGFWHEDKLIAFEDRARAKLKVNRSKRNGETRKKPLICRSRKNGTGKISAKLAIGFAISTVRVTDGTENAALIPMKQNAFARFRLPRTIARIISKRKGREIAMVGRHMNTQARLESGVMNCANQPLSPMREPCYQMSCDLHGIP